ncbi:MAG: hypothetical protein HYW25_02930 [Candidatus Aenigmarchaeota archaeon]|nr:hypothetical protein [Candidatus Aenigmarchaeota archaeon]
MEIKTFFFDTYALYEIAIGNRNYAPYAKNVAIVTTKLNLMELFYGLLTKYGENVADKFYNRFLPYCIGIPDEIIKRSAVFRAANKKKGFSYIDCIGYILSMELKIKFLTGDGAFENMPNVEFVK